MKLAYASVGIDMSAFCAGMKPTTQPGVAITYYASLEAAQQNMTFAQNGQDRAACLFTFDMEDVMDKLTPSDKLDVLGTGALQTQHITNADITWQSSVLGQTVQIPCGQCDWEAGREAISQSLQRVAFEQDGLKFQSVRETQVTALAQRLADEYIRDMDMAFSGWARPYQPTTLSQQAHEIFEQQYHRTARTGGTEERCIIAGLRAAGNTYWDREALQSGFTIPEAEEFVTLQRSFARPSELREFTRDDANMYAAVHLAFLPDSLRQTAVQTFNQTIGAQMQRLNDGQYMKYAAADALLSAITSVRSDLHHSLALEVGPRFEPVSQDAWFNHPDADKFHTPSQPTILTPEQYIEKQCDGWKPSSMPWKMIILDKFTQNHEYDYDSDSTANLVALHATVNKVISDYFVGYADTIPTDSQQDVYNLRDKLAAQLEERGVPQDLSENDSLDDVSI